MTSGADLLRDVELLIDQTQRNIDHLKRRIERLEEAGRETEEAKVTLRRRECALKRMLLQRAVLACHPQVGIAIQPELLRARAATFSPLE